jgi:hypothetical protein
MKLFIILYNSVTLPLLGLIILLSILFCNILSLDSSLNVRDPPPQKKSRESYTLV